MRKGCGSAALRRPVPKGPCAARSLGAAVAPFLLVVDTALLPQYAFNGLVLGAVLALAAMGLTLVYGILDLSNFAHGDLLTAGAYAALVFATVVAASTSLAWAGALLVLAVAVAVLGRFGKVGFARLDADSAAVAAGLLTAVLLGRLFAPELDGAMVVGAAVGAGAVAAGLASALRRRVGTAALAGVAALLAVLLALEARGNPLVLAGVLAAGVVALGSVALDVLVWRRLRRGGATILSLLIVSIGVALALRHALLVKFGGDVRGLRQGLVVAEEFGPVQATPDQLLVLVAAAALVAATHVVLRYTRLGRAMRALADDRDLAAASGIDVDRVVRHVWLLAGALAGVAGVLLGMLVNVHPNMGWYMLLPVFAAVLLGGIGSPAGAMVGAVVLGVVMESTVAFAPEYKAATAFLVLIAVLVLRPQGILGGIKA